MNQCARPYMMGGGAGGVIQKPAVKKNIKRLGRGSGKLRAAFSVGLPPFVGGFPPHPPSCLRNRACYPYMLGTSLNDNTTQHNTTRCKIPAPSLITHQLKEHSSPHFYEAWIRKRRRRQRQRAEEAVCCRYVHTIVVLMCRVHMQ